MDGNDASGEGMAARNTAIVEAVGDDEAASPEEAVAALRKVAGGLAREATEPPKVAVQADAEVSSDSEAPSDSFAEEHREELRILEARLFAADRSLTAAQLAESLPDDSDVQQLLAALQAEYAGRGVNLIRAGGRWAFRTSEDLAYLLERHTVEERRLSRAALETLAIIAYHQPATRAEIEEVRGVSTSRGTLDALMEIGWVKPRGRRRAPGRPLTYGTTDDFLIHFGLDTLAELPGLGELKGAGLLDAVLPPDFRVPQPKELAALLPDELPLEEDEPEEVGREIDDGDDEDNDESQSGAVELRDGNDSG